MTHADKVREAKERALACLDVWLDAFVEGPEMNAMESAGYEVRALVAQTCGVCKGEGIADVGKVIPWCVPCPAGCDNGRRKEAERGA